VVGVVEVLALEVTMALGAAVLEGFAQERL
jgi:hypothetical protein